MVGLLHGTVVGGIAVGLMCNGLAWWDLCAVLGWQGFRVVGWHCGGACMPWQGLCEAGWCHGKQSSVTVSLACRDRVVAVDLHVAKGGGGGHGLHVARWQGLARLEGWDMRVGIMWWRGGGLRTWCVR